MTEAISMQQWLELHKRTLNCIRGALDGITQEQLIWEIPMLKGQTGEPSCGEPRPYSLAGMACHICGAEKYWLREVQIEPEFDVPQQAHWTLPAFMKALNGIEKQYEIILSGKPASRNILFGLGRVCQHNLLHWKSMEHIRMLQDPNWRQPDGTSWENAVDYITDLLILGGKAPLKVQANHNDTK